MTSSATVSFSVTDRIAASKSAKQATSTSLTAISMSPYRSPTIWAEPETDCTYNPGDGRLMPNTPLRSTSSNPKRASCTTARAAGRGEASGGFSTTPTCTVNGALCRQTFSSIRLPW